MSEEEENIFVYFVCSLFVNLWPFYVWIVGNYNQAHILVGIV